MRDHSAFLAYLDAHARTPFAWGSHDCVCFAAGAVRALTGRDLLAEVGHHWTSERGALRLLRKLGGVEGAVDQVLARLPGTAFAHRGDVGLVVQSGIGNLVVFEGDLVVGVHPVAGLQRLRRGAATVAWSAGA